VLINFSARSETWKIAAIENWPPYMDVALGETSMGYKALENALSGINVDAHIQFFPWRRAQYLPTVDESFIGYYCAWPEEVKPGFFASAPIFTSPIGLFSNKNVLKEKRPVLGEAGALEIGLVKSYVYPEPFESYAKQERVDSDATLIKFVQMGRVDFGVIDKYVFEHLLKTRPELKKIAPTLIFHEETAVQKPLVLAFRESELNRARAKRLEQFLKVPALSN